MKTLHYPAWGTLEISEEDQPKPATDEVVLKVAACGICGSELETFKNRSQRRTPPLVMGHEFCGIIAEIGSNVPDREIGDPVVSNSVVSCGTCRCCARGSTHLCTDRQIFGMHRPGAFAEYISVPEQCLIDWPEGLPAESACLAEPLANGIHVANIVSRTEPKTTLIFGAGPIGLMCQQAIQVKIGGTIIVVDLVSDRLEIAALLGANQIVNASQEDIVEFVNDMTYGEGVDLVIDSAGNQTTKQQSLSVCRAGGAVVWIGLLENAVKLDSYDVTLAEKTIFGSYAASLSELRDAVNLLSSGLVDTKRWLQSFPLERGVEAFQRMLAAQGMDIKAVLIP
ncbi:MAG: alcohol dehydrogenase catalytic domain-containing protein [Verrucomicrobia bacterium]|nr:alcohol dehydrogenase catalytic domain-containing protein [Verrucomicrobiota bacterium]